MSAPCHTLSRCSEHETEQAWEGFLVTESALGLERKDKSISHTDIWWDSDKHYDIKIRGLGKRCMFPGGPGKALDDRGRLLMTGVFKLRYEGWEEVAMWQCGETVLQVERDSQVRRSQGCKASHSGRKGREAAPEVWHMSYLVVRSEVPESEVPL